MARRDSTLRAPKMKLVEPSERWESEFLEMAAEWNTFGETRYAAALNDFRAYLRNIESGRREALPAGKVPSTEYWLEDGGNIVACVRLRFRLTAGLEQEGGHIGYDVRPTMRRRGYGTHLLRLALPVLREHGIRRVRITCDEDNIGSATIIEKNGGVLSGTGISAESGKRVRQYWIELS
jgi:predicted acetyltransferase